MSQTLTKRNESEQKRNDEIPKEEDFEKTIADYLTFEFNMIMQDRSYLFENN